MLTLENRTADVHELLVEMQLGDEKTELTYAAGLGQYQIEIPLQ